MVSYKELFILLNIYLYEQSCFVHGAVKGSLVFVIDDTASMSDEISQVKQKTHEVFDAVISSNGSAIDDFVLVTFNDPGTELRIITRDKYAYKREVNRIRVHGGGDCEELAMAGIEVALESSKPNSFLYVFTDASAKDYDNFERVKSLSQKKSTQVTFLLTGLCGGRTTTPDYLVFEKLSKATSGQVFNIEKHDVNKIIDFIIESIKHKKTTLGQKSFGSSDANMNMTFTVDSKIWDVMVSVSAANPNFHVYGPDNTEVSVEKLSSSAGTYFGKLETVPGNYTIVLNNVGSNAPSVLVTGSTSVTFQHGFSTFKPSSINETSTKPIPDQPSFLSIELDNNKRDIVLERVELRDENDNFISELPLLIVNDEQQFYTTEAFNPPPITFKIVIHGYTPTNERITRVAPTTVEYQKPNLSKETAKNLPPKVTILEEAPVNAEYKKPLELHCRVTAYPKPDVVWLNEKGEYIPSTVNAVDLPYEYMSILNLENVEANGTLTCKAHNFVGKDEVSVNIEIKTFLNVLEYPSDTIIEIGTTKDLKLKVDSSPTVTIVWYKGDDIINNSEYFDLSDENCTLTIKDMHPKLKGNYAVETSNGLNSQRFVFKIFISGTEPPKIDKSISNYHVRNGSSVDLLCRIINGKPEPILFWAFDHLFNGMFEQIRSNSSTHKEDSYHIERVDPKVAGAYRCTASNDIGEDSHEIGLIVECQLVALMTRHKSTTAPVRNADSAEKNRQETQQLLFPKKNTIDPPMVEIDNDLRKIVKAGELIQIPCFVDGAPNPSVRWLVNGLKINVTNKYRIYKDNTLSFRSEVHDTGVYTCEASNLLGKVSKEVRLDVFIPVNIEAPEQTIIELRVGDPLILPCTADGFPEPNIKWIYFSKDPKIAPRTLRKDITNSIVIERVQLNDEGIYTCVARNTKSSSKITYEVNVKAPPTIVNRLPDKKMNAVDGDLVLRIPCKAEGNPKPTVTWTFANGLSISTGTEWYDVEEDGTLIIKNVDEYDAGIYICKAENSLGSDFENYKVIVLDYPTPDGSSITNVLVEEGKSLQVKCEVSYKKSDKIRWFKDGRFIKDGDLILNNAARTDSGLYSCRVSNFQNSHSSHNRVIVGFKPSFISDEETNIDFAYDAVTALSCEARGEPKPKIQWWRNDQLIEETSMVHLLFMEINDIGQYTCKVSNEFGTISRTFNIVDVKECTLNISNSFQLKQPVILSSDEIYLPSLQSTDGLLKIPTKRDIHMFCPNSFINIDGIKYGDHITASCVDSSLLNVNGRDVEFANIKCNDKIVPLTKSTGERCGPGYTELLNIGYDIGSEFVGIYDVCIDKLHKLPLYTKHDMYPIIANTLPNEEIVLVESRHLPLKFEDMYNCWQQRKNILSLTGKRLSTDNKCCFAKRQLVSPRDVAPGYQQVATYSYLNVVPIWGTCGTENWDEVEERVRSHVKALEHPLEVYTGTSHLMKLPAQPKQSTVHLIDRFNKQQPVPRYIWKVIINHYEGEAVAIIQINIPDITPYQAFSFMLCKDICHEIEWMRSKLPTEWRDVKKGFTFCCNIKEFERTFGFKDSIFKIRELSTKVLILR